MRNIAPSSSFVTCYPFHVFNISIDEFRQTNLYMLQPATSVSWLYLLLYGLCIPIHLIMYTLDENVFSHILRWVWYIIHIVRVRSYRFRVLRVSSSNLYGVSMSEIWKTGGQLHPCKNSSGHFFFLISWVECGLFLDYVLCMWSTGFLSFGIFALAWAYVNEYCNNKTLRAFYYL